MTVLVDSSVWIDASRSKSKFGSKLKELILNQEVCFTDPIRSEVCQGSRSQAQFVKLWDCFRGFIYLPVKNLHWEECAWNYFRCRKAGITISTMDCLIATIAREYRIPLWTLDKLFKKNVKPVIGFDEFSE